MSHRPTHIPAMTGVRFLAALLVFLYHYGDGSFAQVGSMYQQLFIGVEIFFVLSGFIICYIYYGEASGSPKFLKPYFVKRLARIYPLYFVLTVLTFLVIYKNYPNAGLWAKDFFLNLSFLKGFSVNYFLTGIGPSWSLTAEETFYGAAPLIFVLIRQKKIFFLQVIAWWLIGAALYLFFLKFPFDGFFGNAQFVAFVTFFGRCFEFYCGIWLAIQYRNQRGIFQKLPGKFPSFTLAGVLGISIVIYLLSFINAYYQMPAVQTAAGLLVANMVLPVFIVLFFVGLLHEKTWVRTLFETALLQWLGKSSYAFFLIHTGIIAVAIGRHISSNTLILFVCLQLLSLVIFRFFEFPVNQWVKKKFL